MRRLISLGLMSGTSMDGIDLAVMATDGDAHIEHGPSMFIPYKDDFRHRLEAALQDAKSIVSRADRPADLKSLECELTQLHIDAVLEFNQKHGKKWLPDIIGFHGQTILHRPHQRLTVQLGDGQMLATKTGIKTVFDMRAQDMRHGGQGAPLVPVYHMALVKTLDTNLRKYPLCFVNIGGISNVTYISESGMPIAFDAGPGNSLIDQFVFKSTGLAYDKDGEIAMSGKIDQALVTHYLSNPFYKETVPKSLDRNDFTIDNFPEIEISDGARTLSYITAQSIFMAEDHFPERPAIWVICGGGRRNPIIMEDLYELAFGRGSSVLAAEDLGFNGDSMEAEAWAYLAVRAVRGMPLTFPTTTGCDAPVTGGVIVEP